MANLTISGKLITNNAGKIIADASNIAYSTKTVGSGVLAYEAIDKSVKDKITILDTNVSNLQNAGYVTESIVDTKIALALLGGGSTPDLSLFLKNVLIISNNQTYAATIENLIAKIDISNAIQTSNPDLSNYYTKSEIDNLIGQETDPIWSSDKNNYYTKTEIDNLINGLNPSDGSGINLSDYYNKTNIDELLRDNYYTKEEINPIEEDLLSVHSAINYIYNLMNDTVVDGEISAATIVSMQTNLLNLTNKVNGLLVEITLEDYDALVADEEVEDDVLYLIKAE